MELFSTLRFSVKHGGSVSVTARQQTHCVNNLEQVGGEDPGPSVLRKAKLWNGSRIFWRKAERPSTGHLIGCRKKSKIMREFSGILRGKIC